MRILFLCLMFSIQTAFSQKLQGAWISKKANITTYLLATENYISITESSTDSSKFINVWGGKYTLGPTKDIVIDIDFHLLKPNLVGTSQTFNLDLGKKSIEFLDLKFQKAEKSISNDLDGLWRISERADESGKMNPIVRGPRKTYKLLAGGHFQWIAINTASAEMLGTGGGTYTFTNGKYTEKILFFSRDNKRVGSELIFDAKLENLKWQHSGKSSKGEPILEIWSKEKF